MRQLDYKFTFKLKWSVFDLFSLQDHFKRLLLRHRLGEGCLGNTQLSDGDMTIAWNDLVVFMKITIISTHELPQNSAHVLFGHGISEFVEDINLESRNLNTQLCLKCWGFEDQIVIVCFQVVPVVVPWRRRGSESGRS